jgi:hypothetical protein
MSTPTAHMHPETQMHLLGDLHQSPVFRLPRPALRDRLAFSAPHTLSRLTDNITAIVP